MKTTILILIIILLCGSCHYIPKDVRLALNAAGNNRTELENVIQHYNQDPADS